jgi:hypothetical protein
MNQQAPTSWGPPQPYHQPRYEQPRYEQAQYVQAWPVTYAVAQARPDRGVFRDVALACGTLLVIGALVLAGLMLVPRTSPVVVAGASAPVVAPIASPSVVVPPGGYSCGSTTSGHSVVVENGTVPCAHALTVAAQWLSSGTTPGYGEGSAGTMYSWNCTTTSTGGGWCTSKMGSHLSIGS